MAMLFPLGSQIGFNVLPRHAGGEDGERMSEVDHLIEAAAEKIVDGAHRVISKNSQKSHWDYNYMGVIIPENINIHQLNQYVTNISWTTN